MSSYGSLVMGLLGMNIEKNLKLSQNINKIICIYRPNKNKFTDSYKKWKEVLRNFYL